MLKSLSKAENMNKELFEELRTSPWPKYSNVEKNKLNVRNDKLQGSKN